jgi:hypothetical protein
MAKRWIAINLLLLVSAGLLGWQLRASILRFFSENDLAKIQPAQSRKPTAIQEKSPVQLVPAKNRLPNEFATIPEKTIFSDSRSPESESETVASPDSLPLTQKPILVGVIIADNQYKALILDPAGSSQDKNRRIETKRIGDVYRGYTITGIAADHLVLENGTRREIIPLHEGTKKGQPGKTPILSTRVVPFGGGGVSGGTPIMVPPRSVSTPRVPTVTVNAPVSSSQTIVMPGGMQARTTPPTTPVEELPDPTISPTTPGGTRVIKTPFGDIIRPNRN